MPLNGLSIPEELVVLVVAAMADADLSRAGPDHSTRTDKRWPFKSRSEAGTVVRETPAG